MHMYILCVQLPGMFNALMEAMKTDFMTFRLTCADHFISIKWKLQELGIKLCGRVRNYQL